MTDTVVKKEPKFSKYVFLLINTPEGKKRVVLGLKNYKYNESGFGRGDGNSGKAGFSRIGESKSGINGSSNSGGSRSEKNSSISGGGSTSQEDNSEIQIKAHISRSDSATTQGMVVPVIAVGGLPIPDKAVEGIEIPEINTSVKIEREETKEASLDNVDINYPIIPANPKPGDRVFASAHIYWDKKYNELRYDIIEPPLNEKEKKLIEDMKEYIQEKVDVNFSQIKRRDAVVYLAKIFDTSLRYFHIKSDKERLEVLRYYIFRDFIGLEILEPFLKDGNIEDISCDGANIPIYVYHRNPRFGTIRTNRMFENKIELDSFVNKLSERCGKIISLSKPLLDASLPDGSRVQATLGSDIARFGSNFTIRMFTEKPITQYDILTNGVCDLKMMAYFWYLIENGSSFLISGGTATGKTSLLNVLSLFIKPQMKIVSIEDTAEIRLPHSHWIPEVARVAISEEGKVDMFELLKESLRQRPDYIIVGEVRGREAYVLFQQMAVGHPGISTIHAENFAKLYDRLTSPPISISPNIIQNLDVIIFVKRLKQKNIYIRRTSAIVEVIGYHKQSKSPIINEVFKWESKDDSFKAINKSVLLKKFSVAVGKDEKYVKEEIKKRAKVLEWVVKNNIRDYRKISMVINLYYTSPDLLLEMIEKKNTLE